MTQKFTILFDLDGTLVNSAPDLMHAHNHVMKKYGYDERGLSDFIWVFSQFSTHDIVFTGNPLQVSQNLSA